MTDSAEIHIDHASAGEPGLVSISLKKGSVVLFQATIRIGDPEERDRLVKQIVEKFPGIDHHQLDAELLKIADHVSRAPTTTANANAEADNANAAHDSGKARNVTRGNRRRRTWLPSLGELVKTIDDGHDNIGTVQDIDESGGRANILWISEDGVGAQKWIPLRYVQPLESGTVPRRLRHGAGGDDAGSSASNSIAVPPWKPFPLDALPDLLKRFVEDQAKALGVDPAYVIAPLFPVLAAAIGNSRILKIKNDWTAPAILWVGLIAESGGMKSPTLRSVLKWLRHEEERLGRVHNDSMAKFADEKPVADLQYSGWKAETRKKTAKKVPPTPPPHCPGAPKRERRIVEDTTVEALAPILQASPRGLLLVRDELSGWLDGLNEYKKKGGDVSRWNSLYEALPLSVDRKGGDAPSLYVPRASVSICGGIQPGMLARRMTPDAMESGLLARCLLVYPPRAIKHWVELDGDDEIQREMDRLFRGLFQLKMDRDVDGDGPREITFSRSARDCWARFVNEHGEQGGTLIGVDAAWWSKLEGVAARIALVLAIARDPTTENVEEADVRAGIRIARWWGDEIDRVRALLVESEEAQERRALIRLIEKKGGSIKARDLARSSRRFKHSEDAEAALNELVHAGRGKWVDVPPGPEGGRPTRIFTLLREPVDETPKPRATDPATTDDDTSRLEKDHSNDVGSHGVPSTPPEVSSTDEPTNADEPDAIDLAAASLSEGPADAIDPLIFEFEDSDEPDDEVPDLDADEGEPTAGGIR